MMDDLEPRVRDLLADRGHADPASIAALLDGIAALPRRRARPWGLAAAAVAAVALIALAGIIGLRPSSGPGGPPLPPDPAAFSGDPRLDACFAGAGQVEAVFEMRRARDYPRHLPRMLRSPELEVDAPGFVVVFAGDVSIRGVPASSGRGQTVCILIGETPNLYTDVDTAGLQATVPDDGAGPSRPTPEVSLSTAAGPTVQPAPAWVADLAGQLDCDGPIVDVGQEVPPDPAPFDPAPSPERAIESLLESGMYAWLPAGGFELPQVEGPWALHRYLVVGRLKVIAVSTNAFPEVPEELGWEVVGLRACDPSEFDPAHGLSDGTTLWLDADGHLAPSGEIFSRLGPGHCGWEEIIFLHLDRDQYLRDPEGLLADQTVGPFRTVDSLPADAIDTGLHTPDRRLFTVADGGFVYIRNKDGTIERWARAKDTIGCA